MKSFMMMSCRVKRYCPFVREYLPHILRSSLAEWYAMCRLPLPCARIQSPADGSMTSVTAASGVTATRMSMLYFDVAPASCCARLRNDLTACGVLSISISATLRESGVASRKFMKEYSSASSRSESTKSNVEPGAVVMSADMFTSPVFPAMDALPLA